MKCCSLKKIQIACLVSIGLSLAACVGVTPLNPQAAAVKVIQEQKAKSCQFIDHISTNNMNTLSENPEQEARNKAFNKVAELGGNSLRIISTNTQIAPSGVGSVFTLSGEAYLCK